jgi:hypothetical protein
LPTKAEWEASPNYLPSYQVFCDCLAKALVKQDGLSPEEARKVVEQAFSYYLSGSLVEPWSSRYGIPRLLKIARYIPGARQVWRASRRALYCLNLIGREEIPLGKFLRPSSPYHADFIPIYRAVTEAPPGVSLG